MKANLSILLEQRGLVLFQSGISDIVQIGLLSIRQDPFHYPVVPDEDPLDLLCAVAVKVGPTGNFLRSETHVLGSGLQIGAPVKIQTMPHPPAVRGAIRSQEMVPRDTKVA